MEEIEGIAEAIDYPYDKFLMWTFYYDLGVYCTSALARLQNWTIVHGRNADISDPTLKRNMGYEAYFYKGGRHIYSAFHFAGLVGVQEATKNGAFSISMN